MQTNVKTSHRSIPSGLQSEFQRQLLDEDASGDCEFSVLILLLLLPQELTHVKLDENFFLYMRTLSPAAVDLELRSLAETPSAKSHFATILRALSARLKTHRDFEAVQTFLAVFLRLHGANMVENSVTDGADEVQNALERIAKVQVTEGERILELVANSLGTLSFVRDAP